MQNFFKSILDTLFPIRCIDCKKEGAWLCEKCLSKIPILSEHVCGVCEKQTTPHGMTCLNCKKKNPLDGLVPAVSYKHPSVCKAVHLFKYRFLPDLSVVLGSLITKCIRETELPIPDMIIPIPLHPRRMRWRGFNQSALLAQQVSENLLTLSEIPLVENVLIRKRYTSSQMEIKDYHNRQKNLIGAFSLSDKSIVENKIIFLIDDVATTGSTVFECAKVLKAAGARQVYCAVIARQEL
ncbi:MAG: amidophosphoribosyltransferase family protein [uncultured bacterium]|nr:MAG: amidophosphoribosyltransferase family protein [uncultured bacterium]